MIKNPNYLLLFLLIIVGCSKKNERDGKMNRLGDSQSPYLLQHKNNPVDWYPWSEDAFDKAKKQNKPIFLSIGYSTCHWCHVMEHESFEDNEVAKLMNDNFISIKVDREEMPEIDHLYMSVCQAMTGRGGWPLTIIMTPDKEPFFAGTYFPKKGNNSQPGMMELIPSLMNAWENKQGDIKKTIEQVNEYLIKSNNYAASEQINEETIKNAFMSFSEKFDNEFGGFGDSPKFPSPHNLIFLLRYYKTYGDMNAKNMAIKTLQQMRAGGIYDHIGYGFHRYATDKRWFLPHFEKMLYDQAMISIAYLEAYEATKDKTLAKTTEQIFTYVIRDMMKKNGGFYSAEDADSEGEEGKFYIWTDKEINHVLGKEKGGIFQKVYGIRRDGNFIDEASGRAMPENIPFLKLSLSAFAELENIDINELSKSINESRELLFIEREKRIHPLKDDKILTDWNGLMIAAMAKGGKILKKPVYIDAAIKSADFIIQNLRGSDGKLKKRFRNNQAGLQPHIDDYAFFIWGILELYEATFETRFLISALELSKIMVDDFYDDEDGGFFIGPNDGEKLIIRAKDSYDGAIPSGNAVAAMNCIKLSKYTGDLKWEKIAFKTFKAFSNKINQAPSAHASMLSSFMFGTKKPKEIVIVGKELNEEVIDKIKQLQSNYNPHTIYIFKSSNGDSDLDNIAPWTKTHHTINNKTTYYICENFSCKMPTTDIKTALNYLD